MREESHNIMDDIIDDAGREILKEDRYSKLMKARILLRDIQRINKNLSEANKRLADFRQGKEVNVDYACGAGSALSSKYKAARRS